MANSCKKHSYARVRDSSNEHWYIFCEKCSQTFEPKEGVSQAQFDDAFDVYFKGQMVAEQASRVKHKKL